MLSITTNGITVKNSTNQKYFVHFREGQNLIGSYKRFITLNIGELFVEDLNIKGTREYSTKMRCTRCKEVVLMQSGSALECFGSTQGECT